jgi:hypothetical protein
VRDDAAGEPGAKTGQLLGGGHDDDDTPLTRWPWRVVCGVWCVVRPAVAEAQGGADGGGGAQHRRRVPGPHHERQVSFIGMGDNLFQNITKICSFCQNW